MQSGSGSVTIWGSYNAADTSPIVIISVSLNSQRYCELINSSLLPFAYYYRDTEHGDFMSMHNGVKVHTCSAPKSLLQGLDTNVME